MRHVSPSDGFRFLCYCKDCQAFARFLDRPDVLDPAGGTDIFQMPPGHLKLTAGTDALRCLRLSDRGVLRWYTDCCRTPIANGAGAGFPIISMIHSFVDHDAGGHSSDEVFGPAALPYLRGLCNRAAPVRGAATAVTPGLRPPRIEDAQVVGARARSAESILRR